MNKYMKTFNGEKIFSLEYDKETLRDMVLDLQKENCNLHNSNELLENAIHTLQDKNERLNNIINELEKWLEEDTEKSMMTMETGRSFNMFDILDKLQELKGSVK